MTPTDSSSCFFSSADPELAETIAPACPILFPLGAVAPAINAATGLVKLSKYNTEVYENEFNPISLDNLLGTIGNIKCLGRVDT